ncbi:unnamed protein product [Bursaphelenchus okinawaensis]|uniref:AB hydrolase-1 domain-containing protein n=1 Tax=Bursaphelenchus okinawaensis TaxID=465554 RepID=A0A811K1W8_9BILA|nr:unnamed protein product [Bursaphelenchus okinawaensis]CAG9089014.1 unnamed protein product [Bursaphelenchus okinawaensis]
MSIEQIDTIEERILEDYAEIDDVNIGYERYGHGPNYILGICGGCGSYKKDFPEQVLRAFDPNYFTIVAMDPPGYGKSRPPARNQEINRCKKDAKYGIGLMKHLNLVPFCVLGWSEGARTSIHVAHQGKDVVNRVIVMAVTTRVDPRIDQAFLGTRNTDHWLPETLEPYTRHYPEDFVRVEWAAVCDVVHKVYENTAGRFPSDLVLHTLKQPMLNIYGGKDRFIMDQKYMQEKVPTIRTAVHAQGGHDFYVKYSRWLAMKVTQFFKETSQELKASL